MSRIGNQPIEIPEGVDITIKGSTVVAKGPKGELSRDVGELVKLSTGEDGLVVDRRSETREARGQHGLIRSLLSNMVEGVSKGFEKRLEINGVGYRAEQYGSYIRFDLGYSHPIMFELPETVNCEIERQTKLKLDSVDKELLGQVAAKIRDLRKPEPYKGKGIRYADEVIRRKAGKAGA